ncbi:septum site-determining protein Ssd [Nakamurella lactea]|uniref:septum site-determining protein Ssd n=1 Tax=Nakamurella lactea TaxID=459515 RepID=UPI0003FEDBEE|nr:septum site-determining protein Ssd [Nakamurella lactea]
MNEPLIITDDRQMAEDLLRLAAAAGVEVLTCATVDRSQWRAAPVIVIDIAQVPAAVAAGLPRRDGVIAVTQAEPAADLWRDCVLLGVQRTVSVVEAEEFLVETLGGAIAEPGSGGRAIAVLGACGGAGASVFATAVAVAAHRVGRQVLLADCDRWGAGLDVVLGVEDAEGVRWSDLAAPAGRLSPELLRRALPGLALSRGQLPVLGFDRAADREVPAAVAEVVIDSARRAGDLTVLDLPRVPTAASDRIIEIADLIVLVVPADVRGCFAAQRQVERLRSFGAWAGVVVRGPSPGGIGADDIAQALQLPLLARVRPQARLLQDLEHGRPPGTDPKSPLGRAAAAVLAAVEPVTV